MNNYYQIMISATSDNLVAIWLPVTLHVIFMMWSRDFNLIKIFYILVTNFMPIMSVSLAWHALIPFHSEANLGRYRIANANRSRWKTCTVFADYLPITKVFQWFFLFIIRCFELLYNCENFPANNNKIMQLPNFSTTNDLHYTVASYNIIL